MKFFNNPEIKKSLVFYLIICILLLFLGWQCFLIGIFFTIFHFATTYSRYKKISQLSNDISQILNGNNQINLERFSEGELSILYTEIHKMTTKLLTQAGALQEDRIFLADSIADISHQIRTPLTSINLIVSLLSNPDLSPDRRNELHLDLRELLSRIDWLINTLLKISKLDADTIQFANNRVEFNNLIERAVESLSIPMELKNQTIKYDIEKGAGFTGDFSWSLEAIVNVIKNCTEHTPAGGSIKISALENPLYSEITISDNGNGISKKDLPHLFERFYKGTNSSEQSIGIGLALSRMIILKQNGTIKVSNNIDKGACFTIKFYKGTI